MPQLTTLQTTIVQRICLILLSIVCASCVVSIDTVIVSLDDPIILEQASPVRHTVMSDDHPMALWEKSHDDPKGIILFVHGRTWSALPDRLGSDKTTAFNDFLAIPDFLHQLNLSIHPTIAADKAGIDRFIVFLPAAVAHGNIFDSAA